MARRIPRKIKIFCLFIFLILGWTSFAQNSGGDVTIFIFHDQNNNGQKDADEPYLDGFFPEILDFSGGYINFDEIEPGIFTGTIANRARVEIKGYNGEFQEGNIGESASSVFFARPGEDYYIGISSGIEIDPGLQLVILPCYEGGPAEGRNSPALIEFSYLNNGVAEKLNGTTGNPKALASINQIGATWGVGLQDDKNIYTSALVKRHVGLGPMGVGGVYKYDYEAGELYSYNLSGISTQNSGVLDFGTLQRDIVEGEIAHDASDQYALTKQDGVATYDIDAFDKVGKTGIGDIDVTKDGNQLWLVNLHQNSLVSVDISTGEPNLNTVNAYPIASMPGLPSTDFLYKKNINAGGSSDPGAEAFTDLNQTAWERNKYSNDGLGGYLNTEIYNTMNANDGTSDTTLYQTYRIGDQFEYNIPVGGNGTYTVTLHFAELDADYDPQEAAMPEVRLFNVLAEGVAQLQDYNIIEEAGGFATAVTASFDVDVTDNVLDLEFIGNNSEAVLMGIEIEGVEYMDSGELRPWGLTFDETKGYLGLVADASISKNKDHLYGYVLSFDPSNPGSGFTTELSFPLKYRRERVSRAGNPEPHPTKTSVWEAWVENWDQTFIPLEDEGGNNIERIFTSYPQPILSDIDFDSHGDMVIGIMDRWAHQVGYNNYPPIIGDQTFVVGYASGDILKAAKSSSGGFELESDNNDNIPYYKNDDGPSYNGEFFYEDYFEAELAHHGEIFTGGLGVMPSSDEVILTVFNPVNTGAIGDIDNDGVYTQGTHAYSTTSGAKNRGYLFISQYQYGKANGLGDIEFLMRYPGINIGNYVWCDGNGDGIQQPNENGIPGVELELWCIDPVQGSILVTTTTTNQYGEYYFYNVNANKDYQIRMDLSQPGLNGFQGKITESNAGNNNLLDSDAEDDIIPGYAVIDIENLFLEYNYSYDFGLLGPEADDITRSVCVDIAGGAGTFDLCEIADALKLSIFTGVKFYRNEIDAINNLNSIDYIGTCDYVTTGDTLYTRVYVIGDELCFSISEVVLVVNAVDTEIILTEYFCPGNVIDLEEYIDLGQESLMVFTHEAMNAEDMIVDLNNYVVGTLPETLYFKASYDTNCQAFGQLIIEGVSEFQIDMKEESSICEGETFFISDLDITFPIGIENIETIYWELTLGNGTVVGSLGFPDFESYIPSVDDINRGYVDFTLVASNLCQEYRQRVRLYILNENNIFVDCLPARTVYCNNDSIVDFQNPLFPKPTGIVACDKFIYPELLDVEVEKYDCLEKDDTVGRIVRHWLFELKYVPDTCPEQEENPGQIVRCEKVTVTKTCSDTIYVLNFPDDVDIICPPPMVVLECDTIAEYDEFGRPHPNVSGFPKIGDIDLYPSSDHLFCSYRTEYVDDSFMESCGMTGMFKRNWTITNMCTKEMTTCEQWIQIVDTKHPIIRKDFTAYHRYVNDTVFINTLEKECAGLFYPSIYTVDSCSGIHQVKATINFQTVELYSIGDGIFRAEKPIKIPYGYDPVEVTYESNDSCWNGGTLTHYVQVKDYTPPVISVDDDLTISLVNKKAWLNAESLNEGSYDNCGDVMVFARRVDWETFCVDLCDEKISQITSLEELNEIDPLSLLSDGEVELYYRNMLKWMEEDYACGNEIVEGWRQAIRSYWAENCPPYDEHGNPLIKEKSSFIGGGWSKKVPFGCEDICQDVMVEILVMDQWCNWGKSWATVRVEDNVEPVVLQKLDDISISCDAYDKYYKSIVELAAEAGSSEDDSILFAQLDELLGTYTIAWADQQNRPTHMDGSLMDVSFDYYNTFCADSTVTTTYSDTTHDGYIDWKYKNVEVAYLEDISNTANNGFIGVNCSATITQDIWPILDDCGQGSIMRKFYVTSGCGDKEITRVYVQNIIIKESCPLRPSMFSWPEDTELCLPLTTNSSGNAILPLAEVGEVSYRLPGGCRSIAIGYQDKIYDVVGSETMKKVLRQYTIKDWCSGVVIKREQVIVVNDTCGLDGQPLMILSGTVRDVQKRPIYNTTLNVMESSNTMESYNINDAAYFMRIPYSFDQIYLEKEDNYQNGVSLIDLILTQRILKKTSTPTSVYQKIAADVNNNDVVDINDVLLIRQLILGQRSKFSNVKPWKFVDRSSFKEYADVSPDINNIDNNWIGIKMGDVNNNADYLLNTSRSEMPSYPVKIVSKYNDDGQVIYEFIATQDISIAGFQLHLKELSRDIEIVNGNKIHGSIYNYYEHDDAASLLWTTENDATSVWAGDVLFKIVSNDAKVVDLQLIAGIKGKQSIVVDSELESKAIQLNKELQNNWSHVMYPNPSVGYSQLKVNVPVSGNAIVLIRSIDGKIVNRRDVQFNRGSNVISYVFDGDWVAGVYTYQIITDQNMQTGRFELMPR
ncbi:malectin domain-containing carbohydrate-binding protein [Membranihabitans marinus]|uniref:malectin domain-containing carbohydrate-binding protein n=1 Tax=Membranihabitans marinus TaxID=1227546 RepID=UPI001EEF4A5D|nr:malectin domain-containing carbohydrate-binding protein [Membranihabitans marinus]